jgi:hypothetical protein
LVYDDDDDDDDKSKKVTVGTMSGVLISYGAVLCAYR